MENAKTQAREHLIKANRALVHRLTREAVDILGRKLNKRQYNALKDAFYSELDCRYFAEPFWNRLDENGEVQVYIGVELRRFDDGALGFNVSLNTHKGKYAPFYACEVYRVDFEDDGYFYCSFEF